MALKYMFLDNILWCLMMRKMPMVTMKLKLDELNEDENELEEEEAVLLEEDKEENMLKIDYMDVDDEDNMNID